MKRTTILVLLDRLCEQLHIQRHLSPKARRVSARIRQRNTQSREPPVRRSRHDGTNAAAATPEKKRQGDKIATRA